MIKINNKYAIGQTVYCINKELKCEPFMIQNISVLVRRTDTTISYYKQNTFECRLEEELFESPDALKKHVFEDTLDVL